MPRFFVPISIPTSGAEMTASYSAWPPGTDPSLLRREVARAHEEFVTTGRLPWRRASPVRAVVRDSWRRCRESGLDPEHPSPVVGIADRDLAAYREEHPLAAVLPVIRALLVDGAPGCEQLVAVGDERARLLWVEGSSELISRAEGIGFFEGADWAEATAGTNAPGTSLTLGRPLQIYASEHFSRPVQPWSCAAAPIHDPDSGRVLGVLDLTGGDHIAAPHALSLVRATVAAAENELRLLRLRGAVPAGTGTGGSPAGAARGAGPGADASPARDAGEETDARLEVLGRDRARFTAPGDTRVELSPRHSEIVLLLARNPRGLTGDALGALLHEEESSRVTVRAELSRLRRLLGPGLLASRPYRLLAPVATDAAEVHRRLARGAYRRALAGYPGPLLPRSQAPGVVDAREELDAEVRRTLLHRGDGDLLLDWVGRPENGGDVAALRAALATLPPGSPRRQIVHARLDRALWG